MICRPLFKEEYAQLPDFLYEAIFLPEGVTPPERSIVLRPELALYYEDFGKGCADLSMAAEEDGKLVGCAWARIMPDYGHVDNDTPSLAAAVLKPYRSRGIGAALLKGLLESLRAHGFQKASLSVQKENPAVHLYRRLGFKVIRESEEEYIMVSALSSE